MRFLFFSCRGESDIDFRSSVPVCVYMHKRIVRNNNNNSNTPPLVFFCVSCIDTGLTFFVFGAIFSFSFSNAQLIDGRLVCVRLHCASVSRCCLALACRAGPSYRLFPSPNTLWSITDATRRTAVSLWLLFISFPLCVRRFHVKSPPF